MLLIVAKLCRLDKVHRVQIKSVELCINYIDTQKASILLVIVNKNIRTVVSQKTYCKYAYSIVADHSL